MPWPVHAAAAVLRRLGVHGGSILAVRAEDGAQEARIVVRHGYLPSRIELEPGVPTRLRFDRREADPCSELLVCELLPNRHRLPAWEQTTVSFTPSRPGRYAFTCGLGLYSGELVVRAPSIGIKEDPDMERDLVCGMSVDPKSAQHKAEDGGKTYWFCSAGCKRQFEADPSRYVRA